MPVPTMQQPPKSNGGSFARGSAETARGRTPGRLPGPPNHPYAPAASHPPARVLPRRDRLRLRRAGPRREASLASLAALGALVRRVISRARFMASRPASTGPTSPLAHLGDVRGAVEASGDSTAQGVARSGVPEAQDAGVYPSAGRGA